MSVHIYPHNDGTFVVADDFGWVPGIFADEGTAQAAPEIAHANRSDYSVMQVRVNVLENRAITMADLEELEEQL